MEELNPSPLDKICMLYQLSYAGMVEKDDLNIIFKCKAIGNCFII